MFATRRCMSVRALPSLGAPCLRVPAKPVPEHMFNTPELDQLVEDLVDTMRDARLAADRAKREERI